MPHLQPQRTKEEVSPIDIGEEKPAIIVEPAVDPFEVTPEPTPEPQPVKVPEREKEEVA